MVFFFLFQEHPRPEYETKLLQKKLKNKTITTENSDEVRCNLLFSLILDLCFIILWLTFCLPLMDSLQKVLFGALNQPSQLPARGLVLCSPAVPLKGFEISTLLALQSKAICIGIWSTGGSGSNL